MRFASPRSSVLATTLMLLSLLFATPLLAVGAFTIAVTNTNDSGPGSLREAILTVNTKNGGGTITFAIGSGPQTIRPIQPLPSTNEVFIDGRTQPGFAGTPIIELDGSLTSGSASGIVGYGGTVHSLVINNFPNYGVQPSAMSVINCYVGTDAAGMLGRGGYMGIEGYGHFEGNLVSGNSNTNIFAYSTSTIINNRIGTDVTGNAVLSATTSRNILTSGSAVIEENVIGGASSLGIHINYGGSDNMTIRDNRIGIGRNGASIPNLYGIFVEQSAGGPITGNYIANNDAGVVITENSLRNSILDNRFENNGIGIDLSAQQYGVDGPTANDAGDADLGGNNLTNFPVITRATSVGGSTTIEGTLSAAASREYTIQLFTSTSCSANGRGQGSTLLDSLTASTNAAGLMMFTHTFPSSLASGEIITATATSALEGTSEFSPCAIVEGTGHFVLDPSSITIAEGPGGTATVRRIDGAIGAASVQYATSNVTATAGSDYTNASGTLLFADGETTKTLPLQAVDDGVHEGQETFTLTLSNATGAVLGTPSTATVKITDAQATPSVSLVGSVTHVEGNSGTSPFTFVFKLSGPSSQKQDVIYKTFPGTATAGSDYVTASGKLTFLPGELEKSVEVLVIGDSMYENDESLFLNWTYNASSVTQALAVLNDDPPPTVTAQNVSVRESDGIVVATITLQATAPIDGEIFYNTQNGTALAGQDYTAKTSSVVFSSETTRTITIQILGDDVTEGLESFTVKLFPLWEGFVLETTSVRIDIADDDVGVGPLSLQIPVGQARNVAIQVGGALPADAAFQLVASDPAGFSVPPTVVIPAGSSNTSFDVTALVPGHDGTIVVTFPAALGGGTAEVHVASYIGADLKLTPSSLEMFAGQTTTIRASLVPASNAPLTIRLSSMNANAKTAARDFIIPANGEGTFDVQALQTGPFTITATLPIEYGSETFSVRGRVLAAPTKPLLLSLSPANGSVAGGTEVEVHGLLMRGNCTIRFGSAEPTSFTFVGPELIVVTTPPHGVGTVDLTLRCGSDTSVLPNAFLYRNAGPTLSAVTPASGSELGDTFVRITGTDFVHSCWPVFGGVRSPEARVLDDKNILAVVPPHAAGTADVSLLCSGSEALLDAGFTFNAGSDPIAQIDGIDPLFGSPGDVIIIRGTHLRLDDTVTFSGIAADVLDSTPEAHVVVVPDLPAGPVSIAIDTPAGLTASTTGPVFTIGEAAPPRVTQAGSDPVAAGSEVELEGTALRAPYTFAFGGKVAQIVTMTPWRAVVRLPRDLTPGSYATAVLNGNGQIASMGAPVIVTAAAPVVSGISRRCATTDGGVDIAITGSGFAAGATVTFDSVPATDLTLIDAMTIHARVPPNASGPATIAVTNPDGTRGTRTDAFHYSSPFDPTPNCSEGRGRAVRH